MRDTEQGRRSRSRNYAMLLSLCIVLFAFRVIAQFIQFLFEFTFLPPFEAWHSGALPYTWLLASQILIASVMGWVTFGIATDIVSRKPRLGSWLLILGGIYLGTMLFRLIAGLTFAASHPWLGARLPALFHIVLAVFVLLVGHYHYRAASRR